MIGAVIKKRRLEQNLSQESLCKGICAVSYLSKIESGHVKASDDLLDLILLKLGVVIPTAFSDISDVEKRIQKIWEADYYGRFDEMISAYAVLKVHTDYLSNTDFAIDWHLISARICLLDADFDAFYAQLDTLKTYIPYFTYMHTHYYYMLKGLDASAHMDLKGALQHFERALNSYRNGLVVYKILNTEYLIGNYVNVIHLGNEAYTLLMSEGNLHYAIETTQILAAAYSNVKQLHSAIDLYNRLLQMAHYLKKDVLLYSVYYNLGSTYLACKSFDQAYEKLNHLTPFIGSVKESDWLLAYQKFILCDIGLGYFTDARSKMLLVKERLKSTALPSAYSLILSFEWLFFFENSESPYGNPAYLEAIRATYESAKKDMHYGFSLFYSDYLIEALKAQRRYKEALEIEESLKSY